MDIFSFKNQDLLEQALMHRSALNESSFKNQKKIPKTFSNERLEFLGDSILSFVVSNYLYKNFPDFEEGQLTNLRSNLVKTTTLAQIAQKLGIGKMLKLSKGEDVSGGRENKSILADTMEAIIGALFLDQGLPAVEKFIEQELLSLIPNVLNRGSLKDYKSLLQEYIQDKYKSSPLYSVLKESGPDHAKMFHIAVFVNQTKLGDGEGSSKQSAEQMAAKSALEYLHNNLVK